MKINRNFAKIALFFLFFPTGFNGWNVFLFATDQAATPAAQSKSSPDSPILKIQTEYPNVSPQKNTPISNLPPAKLPSSIPDLSQGKADGLPLYFPGEQKTLLELASWLQNTQDSELKVLSFGPVGFIALNAKSKTFRGKAVQISGRLLKTRYLPILDTNNALNSLDHHKPQNQITNRVIQGFYETWVLLDDNTEIPVRLWTLSIPNENILQDITKGKTNQLYRRERIQATGIYYRLTSFYDGTDFRNTPMLVAKNFSILENAQNNATREVSDPPGTTKSLNHLNVKIICVALVVLLWLVYRFFRRKRHRTTLADHDAAANLTSLGLVLFCFIAFSLGTVRVWGASEKTPSPESNPQSLPTDDRLSELPNDMPTMLQVLARVQCQSVFWDGLPPERRSAFLRKQSVFPDVKSPNDLRYPFWGKITQIKQVPIPGAPRDSEEKPYYYRCLISTKDAKDHTQSIIVYAASLPSFQINRVGRLADIG
ncbi:MAG: hypothetical protein PHQ75_14645, partial [Thermoguttaceae bacterium]|nr:hypothetical protein [Thermoguttaceae bacterium]